MTFSTSADAVCCSSASLVSLNRRDVLDRDHRLRGEGLEQRHLVRLVNGAVLAAHDRDRAPAPRPRATMGTFSAARKPSARWISRMSRRSSDSRCSRQRVLDAGRYRRSSTARLAGRWSADREDFDVRALDAIRSAVRRQSRAIAVDRSDTRLSSARQSDRRVPPIASNTGCTSVGELADHAAARRPSPSAARAPRASR